MQYNLSKDYVSLFRLISAGEKVAAFVDYSFFNGDGFVFRDVCQVKRTKPYDITIGVRGTGYGGIDPFEEKQGKELDLFIRECESMNLGWVNPQIDDSIRISSIEKVNLSAGDVVVLKHEQALKPEQRQSIKSAIKDLFPNNKTLVLDGGLDIEVITNTEAENNNA